MAPELTFFGDDFCLIFFGKVGRIRAKFLRTPKNLPAPTPMREGDSSGEIARGGVALKNQ